MRTYCFIVSDICKIFLGPQTRTFRLLVSEIKKVLLTPQTIISHLLVPAFSLTIQWKKNVFNSLKNGEVTIGVQLSRVKQGMKSKPAVNVFTYNIMGIMYMERIKMNSNVSSIQSKLHFEVFCLWIGFSPTNTKETRHT